MVRFYSARESGITSLSALLAAVAELADALDSKSSGAIRAGSSPASGILVNAAHKRFYAPRFYTLKMYTSIRLIKIIACI